jgi:hypothetical protein
MVSLRGSFSPSGLFNAKTALFLLTFVQLQLRIRKAAWQLFCYSSARLTTIEQTTQSWPMRLPPTGCARSCGKSCRSACPRYANWKGGQSTVAVATPHGALLAPGTESRRCRGRLDRPAGSQRARSQAEIRRSQAKSGTTHFRYISITKV